jgi:hypothetical protein
MLELQFSCSTASDTSIQYNLDLKNNGNVSYPLSDITIRYWYAADSGSASAQNVNCYYTAVTGGCANLIWPAPTPASGSVTATVHEISPPLTTSGTNFYLEVGFTAGAGDLGTFLSGGTAETGQIQIAMHYANYMAGFNPNDDYSYPGTCTNTNPGADNMKMTVYVRGVLAWGTEPQ